MNLTIGQASIFISIGIVIVTHISGLKIVIGTVANMILIGLLIDLIIYIDLVPTRSNLLTSILLLIGSMFVNALGSYLYIGCELGCGPRDGLMVVLVKLTSKPISLIRFLIEGLALSIGWGLGGTAGFGTLIIVFNLGYCVQLTYKIFNFEVDQLQHKDIKKGLVFINKSINK